MFIVADLVSLTSLVAKRLIAIKYLFLIKSYLNFDDYLFLPCASTKDINTIGKSALEVFIQWYLSTWNFQ